MNATATAIAPGSMEEFERTTSRWGRLTMLACLAFALAGPTYLVLFADLGIGGSELLTAVIAVVGTFFVIFLVEPITYYPILGQASMYQAFMIGNISNKLLPAALIAQTRIGATPGTARGSLAAVAAIAGAAAVHMISLLVLVGLMGTWIISVLPPQLIDAVRDFILPAVLGAVILQAIVSLKQVRATVIATIVAAVVQFVLVPLVPSLGLGATAVSVIGTLLVVWILHRRSPQVDGSPDDSPTA